MPIEFLSQANENYMADADVVSCYLHALALSIYRRSNYGDGGMILEVEKPVCS